MKHGLPEAEMAGPELQAFVRVHQMEIDQQLERSTSCTLKTGWRYFQRYLQTLPSHGAEDDDEMMEEQPTLHYHHHHHHHQQGLIPEERMEEEGDDDAIEASTEVRVMTIIIIPSQLTSHQTLFQYQAGNGREWSLGYPTWPSARCPRPTYP